MMLLNGTLLCFGFSMPNVTVFVGQNTLLVKLSYCIVYCIVTNNSLQLEDIGSRINMQTHAGSSSTRH